MSAAETWMKFHPAGRRPVDSCEVFLCNEEKQDLWPLPRRMCRAHACQWLDPVFRGCGCGPEPCPSCRRHIDSGLRVIVVGERENGRQDHPYNSDERLVAALGQPGFEHRHEMHLTQFQKRRRAFSWGSSRRRLVDLGLRWDMAMNLLGSSPAIGSWDRAAAARVAAALAPHLAASGARVVLLGVRVAEAFDFGLFNRTPLVSPLRLPHPSGRSRVWNESGAAERWSAAVSAMYEGKS